MKKTLVLFLFIFTACSAASTVRYPPSVWLDDRDREPIAKPGKSEEYKYWDYADKQFFYQLARLGDLPERFGAIVGAKQEALNVNNFDEVADSTWFTNRIGRQPLSIAEITKASGTGPDSSGSLTILSGKTQGISPGLFVKDAKGERYLLKFDPGGNMEMATGAEVISTLFLNAIGYNVPQNTIFILDSKTLKIDPNATTKDSHGNIRPFIQTDLDDILSRLPVYRSGHYRAMASKIISGELLGPFPSLGRRGGDSNDRIPHQHRRELRGYRVFSAFLNNIDSREANTLDTFLQSPGTDRGYVKHYLIDFGATLGSRSYQPKSQEHLYDYIFNYGRNLKRLAALGTYKPYWEKAESPEDPAIGFFESKVFDPPHWKPSYPNPAFQNMTDRDGFWATKILMRFSDEAIRAIVKEAEYSNPKVSDYIEKTLIERRDKIGRYWYKKMNPLDGFRVEGDPQGLSILFNDLAIDSGFEKQASYRYRVRDQFGKVELLEWTEATGPRLSLTIDLLHEMRPGKFYVIQVETLREGDRFWSPPVELIFYKGKGADAGPQLLGLLRKYSD